VKICLKKCLVAVLITASLFASWQGFNANCAALESRSSENNVSSLHVDEPSILPGVTENEITGYPALKAQWTQERIKALSFTPNVNNTPPVLVAILDTGIDKDHEDLRGMVVAEINLSESATADDIFGHGTFIAGIIAADADNGLGITGVAPESRLINVKVANDKGTSQDLSLADGIIWAVDHGARVINISIAFKNSSSKLKEAVDYAWNKGAIIIAAAGNDGNSLASYPAYYDNCLAVTAIRENGTLAPMANYGDWVDVAAPGYKIYSTSPQNSYGYKYGTSFATAYVSGLAAVLFTIVTDTNGDGRLNDEVRQAIETGCRGIDFSPRV
jgi:thermitase